MMITDNKRKHGFLYFELLISMAIIGLILVALAMVMSEFRTLTRIQLLKQQCIAAGQSQLESVAAGEGVISDETIERLWPDVTVEVTQSAGAGRWEGLTLVEVSATGEYLERLIEVHLFRYMASESDY
ncbi:MAG: type II secretion system protein [Planctomycetes bacterium]|nr:type II secretion system protein [Planctomycetota bacterium]